MAKLVRRVRESNTEVEASDVPMETPQVATQSQKAKEVYRIATFDGGGMCGIISLRFMELLDLDVSDFFMLSGVSTGGLICVGLASGLTTAELREFYYEEGPKIFHRSFWQKLSNPYGLTGPLYSNENLQRSIRKALPMEGRTTLPSLYPKVMVPAYNYKTGQPKFWKSWRPEDSGATVLEVCTATACAPTYFDLYGDYADGGLVANNPTLCAIIECMKFGIELDQLEVYSFGTGEPRVKTGDNKHSGRLGWAPEIAGVFLSAMIRSTHHHVKILAGQAEVRRVVSGTADDAPKDPSIHRMLRMYRRFDVPKLPDKLAQMDDADQEIMRAREAEADKYFDTKTKTCPWLHAEHGKQAHRVL